MIINGVQIPGAPVTMVKLSCGHTEFVAGHGHEVGAEFECEAGAEGDCRTYDAIGCTIAEVFETETVNVVDTTVQNLVAQLG